MKGQRAKGRGQRELGGGRSKGRTPTCLAVLLVTIATLLLPVAADAQQLVIFVRHGERADGGAGTDTMTAKPADPSLSEAGHARAAKLAATLADAGIKAIYATEFKRTQETAKPLADKLQLTVQTMPSGDAAALVAKVKADHPKDIVLVIGHSNTLPAAIKAFGGPDVKRDDSDYGAIYILAPASGALTRIRY